MTYWSWLMTGSSKAGLWSNTSKQDDRDTSLWVTWIKWRPLKTSLGFSNTSPASKEKSCWELLEMRQARPLTHFALHTQNILTNSQTITRIIVSARTYFPGAFLIRRSESRNVIGHNFSLSVLKRNQEVAHYRIVEYRREGVQKIYKILRSDRFTRCVH